MTFFFFSPDQFFSYLFDVSLILVYHLSFENLKLFSKNNSDPFFLPFPFALFDRTEKKKGKSLETFSSVLEASDAFEGLQYRPKSKETKATYELILSFIQQHIGDQPQDILRASADEIISFLKDENLKDLDKKKEIESLLGAQLASDRFSQLVNLGKKITDFNPDSEKTQEDAMDEEVGVAVVFEDESEEEEGDAYEVKDEEEQEDDGEEAAMDLVLAQEGEAGNEDSDKSGFTVSVKDIDAFWLQRKISEYYNDAITSQAKTKAVMDILKVAKDDRDCENKLVLLLDYDKFDLVKLITRNRLAILYCTLLGQAQTPQEREDIEATMKADPSLAPILKGSLSLLLFMVQRMKEENFFFFFLFFSFSSC